MLWGFLYRSGMFSHHDDNLYDHDLGLLSVSSPIHGVVFPIHDDPFAVHEYLCVVVHIIFYALPNVCVPTHYIDVHRYGHNDRHHDHGNHNHRDNKDHLYKQHSLQLKDWLLTK
ncbi:hypothetical protein AB237_3439 [Acinetobacter baumannii NCGM 237]|nr:hypothetical protein AB237_3439 [Acinetobacter baumannii NCGM 237]